MKAHECFHCKQWVEADAEHDCWTTTEAALTRDLPEELRDAWERLRETAADFGEQRIYASHHSIMFARKVCYFFVRPKRKVLEVFFFLDRTLRAPAIKKAVATSKTKVAHMLHVTHRDQVEAPLTDWLQEAYELEDKQQAQKPVKKSAKKLAKKPSMVRRRSARKPAARSNPSGAGTS